MTTLTPRPHTFGRQLLAVSTAAEMTALEAGREQATSFRQFDATLAALIKRSLAGDRICRAIDSIGRRPAELELIGLSKADAGFIDARFGYDAQRTRGAWYLRPEVRLEIGLVNVGAHLASYPRVFWNAVVDETVKASLVSSTGAVLVWGWLEEVFRRLAAPLYLRGPGLAELSREEQMAEWAQVETSLVSLGLDAARGLGSLRYGAGWAGLNAADRLAAKQRYVEHLCNWITPTTVSRLRALTIRPLVERYYAKAKVDGSVLRRIAVTKALEPVLSGVFGGDWLAFLAYIEERPHAQEQITTELPEPTLRLAAPSTSPRTQDDSLPKTSTILLAPAGQIEDRLAFLRKYWERFDKLHADQKHGMDQLRGLVPARLLVFDSLLMSRSRYGDTFPREFVGPVAALWGKVAMGRWPELVVSEPYPAARMAEAFGPALDFWNRVGVACWNASEWADESALSELPRKVAEDLGRLAELGCPANEGLFEELRNAETGLGAPQPISEREKNFSIGFGVSLTVSVNTGSWRPGYERLRDVLTWARRHWAQGNLDRYLQARWRSELQAAATEFHRHRADRGKPPTVKQFVGRPVVSRALNNWLGGEIDVLYAMIGIIALQPQQARAILPPDRNAFARSVINLLGGLPQLRYDEYGGPVDRSAYDKTIQIQELAQHSLHFVQLVEVLGRAPSLNEFGEAKIARAASVLETTADNLWTRYAAAVQDAVAATRQAMPARLAST